MTSAIEATTIWTLLGRPAYSSPRELA